MSSNDNKHPCDDLTPDDDCNRTCCPDYQPDSDWCKAFNKRTLEQLKEVTDVSIDGMWFNIEDAKNTIAQIEQYLTMIYELLLACQDQVVKASSSTARTMGDFDSASLQVKEYVKEINLIVGGAQYNGRHLLQDTTTAKRGLHDATFDADSHTAYTAAPFNIIVNVNGAVAGAQQITIDEDADNIKVGDIVYDKTGDQSLGTVSTAGDGKTFSVGDNVNVADNAELHITPFTRYVLL